MILLTLYIAIKNVILNITWHVIRKIEMKIFSHYFAVCTFILGKFFCLDITSYFHYMN